MSGKEMPAAPGAGQQGKKRRPPEEPELMLKNIISFLPDPTFVIDRSGKVLAWNRAIESLTGVPSDEMVGKGDHEYAIHFYGKRCPVLIDLILNGEPRAEKKYVNLAREDGTMTAESYITVKGRNRYVIGNAALLRDTNGEIVGAIETFSDITDRRRMEEELQAYSKTFEALVEEGTAQLRETERLAAIGETATIVGHDLRNPLQAMVNSLYLLKDEVSGMEEAKKRVYPIVNRLEKNLDYMSKIVLDLQDFARPLKVEKTRTDAKALLTDVIGSISVSPGIVINLEVWDGLELHVDTLLARRVFTNLITNAVQAMPDGGSLKVKAIKAEERAEVSIEDTGIGISEENLKNVFKPLFTTKAKGQGFGLAVSRRLVEAHGGTIEVASTLGKGAKFTVRFPAEAP